MLEKANDLLRSQATPIELGHDHASLRIIRRTVGRFSLTDAHSMSASHRHQHSLKPFRRNP